ncbi:hypothetical protein [Sulfurimonas sp.]|jgi:hypothetical protein|uniref:hypothetical protein n=1 Tax=Sulfurimonas sp. TaxID=2022749 RepID=UPI0025EF6D22|nr:hypothetical protein [Sulfurimonas sp.]MBT5934889.1 hypothetical protein [Sulfurimonas sp.]
MTIEEVEFELEMAGLSREQQIKLLSSIRRSGFDAKALDKKLLLMGFAPVFTIYDDKEEDS